VNLISTILNYIPGADGLEIVAKRTSEHPKGPKELMRINLGDPIPAGIILGKGTYLSLEIKRQQPTKEE
jgi:hypothetical protein